MRCERQIGMHWSPSHARVLASAALVTMLSLSCGADGSGIESRPPPSTILATDSLVDDTPSEVSMPEPNDPTEPPASTSASTTAGGDDDATDHPTGSLTPGLQGMVDIAVADLMARRGLSNADDIDIVAVDEVVWRDRGLGCPRKDMQYAQVLTDGTRIVLATDGVSYHYHAGHGRDPFYCPNPEPPVGE